MSFSPDTGCGEPGGAPVDIGPVERRPARGPATGAGRRPRVLLLIKCLGYGGAEQLLVDVVANRDADAFDYEVAYVLAGENALVPAVEASGVTVHRPRGPSGNADLSWLPVLRRLLCTGSTTSFTSTFPMPPLWAVWWR